MDNYKTDVIFRRFKDTWAVIALFPGVAGNNKLSTCSSYMHIGQHGIASVDLNDITIPVSILDSDVVSLIHELESYGYNLNVVKRFTKFHQKLRENQINHIERKTSNENI